MNDLRDKVMQAVADLNDDGINLVNKFFDLIADREEFQASITPERKIEIVKNHEREQQEADALKLKKKEEHEEMLKKYAGFFERLDKVKTSSFNIYVPEVAAIAERNRNNLFDMAVDYIKYGYLQGQKKEKTKQRAKRKGGMNGVIIKLVEKVEDETLLKRIHLSVLDILGDKK